MVEFIKAGGPFMILLIITSIVALTFIIERSLALRWNKVIPSSVQETLESSYSVDSLEDLKIACRERPSTLSRLLLTAINHLSWNKGENEDALQTLARREVVQLERGLVVLEVIVGIAPLLGLVGTLHGLITLFSDLGRTGLGDNAELAKGIAIALNTTLMGLLIAIPSLVTWSYFTKKVEVLSVEMETLCDEFLRRFYQRKKKF